MVMPKQNKKSEYRLGIFFFGNKLIMTDIFLGLMLICMCTSRLEDEDDRKIKQIRSVK